jgi:Transcriptional regulatory protein, C terminal/AAA ATPase domain
MILARSVYSGKTLANCSTQEVVGREAEIELLLTSLAGSTPSIWYVHGIAGIGKSTLLRAVASAADQKGWSVVLLDGRSIEPITAGFLASLSQQIGRDVGVAELTTTFAKDRQTTAIIIDNYESLTLLDAWVRQVLVPALPSSAGLVIAAREPPGPGWRRDSPCNVMLRTLALKTLDRAAAEQLLARFGFAQAQARAINGVTAGHPLALVLAGSKLRDWAGAMTDALVDVNLDLAQVYLSGIDNKNLREAIEAASVVRRVTTPMLSALLPSVIAPEIFERLRGLPFVEVVQDGLDIHDAVRGAVAAALELADPPRFHRYQRAAWRYIKSEARRCSPGDMWRHTADMIYLLRNPVIREAFFPSTSTNFSVDRVQPADIDDVIAIASRSEPEPIVGLVRNWLAKDRSSFFAIRDRQNQLVGFHWTYDPARMDFALVERDPLARAWWARHRRGGDVKAKRALFIRRCLSAENGEAPCDVQAAAWLDIKRMYMEMRPDLRWVYLTLNDPAPYASVATKLGFLLPDDVRVEIASKIYHTAILNMGPDSFDGWISRLLEAEIGQVDSDVFDERSRQFTLGNARIQLSVLEFAVMRQLYVRDGLPVQRDELLREVWGEDFDGQSNVVDAVIREIRRKLGPQAHVIRTVRGIGYSLQV